MQEEGHTNRCLDGRDPTALYEHYLRQLVLVASHGNDQARRLFIRAHQSALGGYAGYLLHLSEEHLRVAFVDALTAQQGSWPETLMGFRLAVPARPPDRRTDVWSLWKGLDRPPARRPGSRSSLRDVRRPARRALRGVRRRANRLLLLPPLPRRLCAGDAGRPRSSETPLSSGSGVAEERVKRWAPPGARAAASARGGFWRLP